LQRGLSSLRVVEFSTGIAGAYCCRLLADAGADVVKVEPATGDPWRTWSAGGASVGRDEGGALFRFLHHGVRAIVADPGDAEVAELVAGADVVVESFAPSQFDSATWTARHPGLVVCSITPYGRGGPYAGRPTTEFIVQAESGGLVGRGMADALPFQCGGRTSEWLSGTFASAAVTAAALRAQRTGHGEHIDFAIVAAMTIAANSYAEFGQALRGNPPIVAPARTIETPSVEPTVDGYVGFCTNSRDQFNNFCLLIERADLVDGDFTSIVERQKRWKEWNDIVHAWTTRHTTADIVQLASELRIPVAPVLDGETVRTCDHFVARGAFVDDPTGAFVMPRRPWRMDDEDPPPPSPSPRLGEHTGAIEPRVPARPPSPVGDVELPLVGYRVLDLTAWWAGPIAAGVLAALGADVIHVESISRIDGMRTTGASVAGLEGPWWERSAHYLVSNVNKRDLTLDLGTEQGLAMLRALIAESDAVLENFSPRVLTNFGLDWEQVQEINPRCVLVRMPAFGLSGPWRDNTGFAQTMEQVTGMAWITGHRDDQPRIQRGPSDPNAGMHAAFAMLVGFAEREATGRGCHLEVTMVEGALNAASELVIEATAYGNLLERDGNRSPNVAPQGLYPARGDDNWIAISVETDEQWARLVRAFGDPAWATDPALATYAARRARHDELDDHLEQWCATQDAAEAVDLLIAHGVPAAIGWDPRRMYDHPQLGAWHFHEEVDHPVVGRHQLPTLPFRYASVDRWVRTPAPLLGEHNHDILVGDLGISEADYAALAADGIIGDRPRGA
jgi:crotonobetainyl-CoA:carnitine CoA-transferase CaiB-like acyl-CoA transferase